MKKIILTIIAVIAIAAIVVLGSKKAASPSPEAPTQESQRTAEAGGKKIPFSAFVKGQTAPYRCEVDQYLSDMDTEGVVYLDGGKMRGEFSTVAEGKPMETSFLIKDGYQYVWSSGMTAGIKLPVAADATGSAQADASGVYSWNAEQIGEYDCKPWGSDAAKFVLPAGITFTELPR